MAGMAVRARASRWRAFWRRGGRRGGGRAAGGAAGAQESGIAADARGVTCETVMVQMRDGVRLATDVYRPAAPGPVPGDHAADSPYGLRLGQGCFARPALSGGMAFWAEHGYASPSRRTPGARSARRVSSGPFTRSAATATTRWSGAAAQPWSNGRVAMTGGSYMGVTQWQARAGRTAPPGRDRAPNQTATDYHDHWTYVNGVFDLWFGQSWPLAFFAPDAVRRALLARGASAEQARGAARTTSWRKASGGSRARSGSIRSRWRSWPTCGPRAPYYREWLAHPEYDDYWAGVDVEAQWDSIRVPGAGDRRLGRPVPHRVGAGLRRRPARRRRLGGGARRGTMLVMTGGGGHGREGRPELRQRGADGSARPAAALLRSPRQGARQRRRAHAPRAAVRAGAARQRRAQGTRLLGDRRLVSRRPARRRCASTSPAAAARQHALGRRRARQDRHRRTARTTRFVYDPRDPVPRRSGGGLCCLTLGFYFRSGVQDQSTVELRDDVLVYTSAPLDEDLAVIGAGQGEVLGHVVGPATPTSRSSSSTCIRTASRRNVLNRVVRARFRHGSKSPASLIEPGPGVRVRGRSGVRPRTFFRARHRVRLDLSSSAFPHLARNHNTGSDPATDARFEVARQTVHHDASRPSYVDLAVVPGLRIASR